MRNNFIFKINLREKDNMRVSDNLSKLYTICVYICKSIKLVKILKVRKYKTFFKKKNCTCGIHISSI